MNKLLLCFLTILIMPIVAASEAVIRIGAIIPVTGPGASYGAAIKNGFTLAKKEGEINSLQLIWEDSRLDSAAAVSAYRKLTTIDKVDVVFVWGAGPAEAVVPIAARDNVPTIAITADRAISLAGSNVFRFHYHADDYVKPLAAQIRDRKLNHLALITTQIAYFDVVERSLRTELGPDFRIRELGSLTPSDTDFRSVIMRIKELAPDGLLVFLLPGQISSFHRQAEQLGLHLPMFGTDFYDSQDEIVRAGKNADGAVFPAFAVDEGFRDRYLEQFENDEQLPYAANTYDFINFFTAVSADMAKPMSTTALIDALRSAPPYKGVSGEYVFVESAKGSGFDVQLKLKEVRDGKLKYLSVYNHSLDGSAPHQALPSTIIDHEP